MPLIGATNPYARRLRRDATECEARIWLAVRNRRLAGHKFRRQATIGPYVADFLCVEQRLVVEIDGGQHGDERDAARTAWLEARGFRVLRFWNTDVIDNINGVLATIVATLHTPSPNPFPQAGEGYSASVAP
ncbi:endonuclease domain-containing protein [Sphingomonas sp. RS2018]